MYSRLLLPLLLLVLLPLLPHLTRAFVLEGSKTSYAQFPRWEGRDDSSLSLEFRTDQPSGLLLYTQLSQTCHFLQLKLTQGNLQLRLNTGHGSQVVSVASRGGSRGFSDGAWHQVTLQRDGSNTTLKVDNIIAEKVICHDQEIRPGGSNISGDQNVYVGGLPSWYSTKLKVGSVIVLQGRRRFTLLSPSR